MRWYYGNERRISFPKQDDWMYLSAFNEILFIVEMSQWERVRGRAKEMGLLKMTIHTQFSLNQTIRLPCMRITCGFICAAVVVVADDPSHWLKWCDVIGVNVKWKRKQCQMRKCLGSTFPHRTMSTSLKSNRTKKSGTWLCLKQLSPYQIEGNLSRTDTVLMISPSLGLPSPNKSRY